MKILVTGGAGFIGRYLVEFLSKSHQVTIYDNLSNSSKSGIESLISKGVKFVKGDVLDYELLQKSSLGNDLVIHLAAKTSVADSIVHPQITQEVNVIGAENVCKSCVQNKIKKIIFASTAAVYADSKVAVNENSNTNPQSPYGQSKLSAEKLIKKFAQENEIDAITLRIFNVYGKGQNLQYAGVITKFISNVSNNLSLEINGDGTQTRDFISIHDVIAAFDCAIKNINEKRGDIFNVGTGKAVSVNELAGIFQKIDSKITIKHKEEIPGEIKHSVADISLAKEKLGFVAKQKLKDDLVSLL